MGEFWIQNSRQSLQPSWFCFVLGEGNQLLFRVVCQWMAFISGNQFVDAASRALQNVGTRAIDSGNSAVNYG